MLLPLVIVVDVKINLFHCHLNNAYRRVFSQPWRCSASAMYPNFGISKFEATIRKSTCGFTPRLAKSTNSLIMTLEKSWIVRIVNWNFCPKKCRSARNAV